MPIDPNIALGVKPLEVANPINAYAQMAQLQHYQQQNELANRAIQQEEAVNRAYANALNPETGQVDRNKLRQNMAAGGAASKLPALEKTLTESDKAAAELQIKNLEAQRGMFSNLAMNPSDENVKAHLQDMLINRQISPEQAQQRWGFIQNMNLAQRADYFNKAAMTSHERLSAMPVSPEIEAQKIRIAQASRPITNITNVQEKAEQGARGKMLVDQYTDISKAAGNAAKTLPSVESNLGILNKGFDTGFGTEAKTAGAKVLASLGVQDAEKYATNSQAFLANASQAVLQKQLDQKGPQTESDAQRITQTGAQLGNTKAANEFVLQVAKAQLKRDIDQRNFYDNWYKNNKTYDGAESAWYAGQGGASLFDRPELKKYKVETQAQPAAEVKDNRQSLGSIFGGKKP